MIRKLQTTTISVLQPVIVIICQHTLQIIQLGLLLVSIINAGWYFLCLQTYLDNELLYSLPQALQGKNSDENVTLMQLQRY